MEDGGMGDGRFILLLKLFKLFY